MFMNGYYQSNFIPPNMMQNQFYQNAPQTLIKVTGMEGAKAYQMLPNSVAALFDANENVFYIKSTDGAGFPTINAFSFSAIETKKETNSYVTREEFEKLCNVVRSISGGCDE